MSGRNLTDTGFIEQMAGAGVMILAGLVSVCAAFCSLVATTLLETQHHEHERARLVGLRDQYTRHIDLIQKDLARLQKPPDPSDNQVSTPPVPEPEPPKTPPTAAARRAGRHHPDCPDADLPDRHARLSAGASHQSEAGGRYDHGRGSLAGLRPGLRPHQWLRIPARHHQLR